MDKFINSPSKSVEQGTGGGFMSPGQGLGGSPGQSLQTVTPVTSKQVAALEVSPVDDVILLDGKELNQVTMIGRIVELKEQSNQIKFSLNDTTGVVDIVYWNDDDPVLLQRNREIMKYILEFFSCIENSHSPPRIGSLLRIMGTVKPFGGRKTIQAYRMFPVNNLNEIDFHNMEIVRNHLRNVHGEIISPADATGGNDVMMGGNFGIALSPLQNEIVSIIKKDNSKYGLTAQDIKTSYKPDISLREIGEAIRILSEEGYLYSTSDESHFKATEV